MRFIALSLMLISCAGMAAQRYEADAKSISGGLLYERFSFLILSFDYSNNSDIIGKYSNAVKQPAFSTTFSYSGKSGIDASVTGFLIGNSDDSLEHYTYEADLMIGYRRELFGCLTLFPAYSRFMYSSKSNELQKIFTDELRMDIDYNYRYLNIGLTPGFYLGQQHTFYTNFRNYYNIDFSNVIFNNSLLSIQPGFDLNFGDFEYLNLYYLDKMKDNDLFYMYLLLSREIWRYVHFEMMEHPELTAYQILDQYLNEKVQDAFKLTSASFYVPLNYMVGNFGFSAGFYAFVPIKQPEYLNDEVQFFFNLGISYSLAF